MPIGPARLFLTSAVLIVAFTGCSFSEKDPNRSAIHVRLVHSIKRLAEGRWNLMSSFASVLSSDPAQLIDEENFNCFAVSAHNSATDNETVCNDIEIGEVDGFTNDRSHTFELEIPGGEATTFAAYATVGSNCPGIDAADSATALFKVGSSTKQVPGETDSDVVSIPVGFDLESAHACGSTLQTIFVDDFSYNPTLPYLDSEPNTPWKVIQPSFPLTGSAINNASISGDNIAALPYSISEDARSVRISMVIEGLSGPPGAPVFGVGLMTSIDNTVAGSGYGCSGQKNAGNLETRANTIATGTSPMTISYSGSAGVVALPSDFILQCTITHENDGTVTVKSEILDLATNALLASQQNTGLAYDSAAVHPFMQVNDVQVGTSDNYKIEQSFVTNPN